MPIAVRGSLTRADLLAATKYVIWHRSPALKVMCAIACIILLAGIASIFLGMGITGLPPVILSAAYLYFLYRLPVMTVNKQLKTFAHYSEEAEYEFSEELFRISWTSLEVSWRWTSIESKVELPEVFLIFPAKTTVHTVPKRLFSEEQLAIVRDMLFR